MKLTFKELAELYKQVHGAYTAAKFYNKDIRESKTYEINIHADKDTGKDHGQKDTAPRKRTTKAGGKARAK